MEILPSASGSGHRDLPSKSSDPIRPSSAEPDDAQSMFAEDAPDPVPTKILRATQAKDGPSASAAAARRHGKRKSDDEIECTGVRMASKRPAEAARMMQGSASITEVVDLTKSDDNNVVGWGRSRGGNRR